MMWVECSPPLASQSLIVNGMGVETDHHLTNVASHLRTQLLSTVDQLSKGSTDGSADASTSDEHSIDQRFTLLAAASPLFSQLRGIARRAHDEARRGKKRVADTRSAVDQRSLLLQNLKYQKRHLQDEIRQCKAFQSKYQTVALVELDEFREKAPEEDRGDEVLNDAHALQLARLRFELNERKRLEELKRAVQARKATLAKENRAKKQRLEGLEGDLKEMLSRSVQVRRRFEEANKELEEEEEERKRREEDEQEATSPAATEQSPKGA